MIKIPKDKPIRLKTEKWQDVKNLANDLSEQLGLSVSLPDAISYVIKFYRENQPNTAGTPGGKSGSSTSSTGTVKGSN